MTTSNERLSEIPTDWRRAVIAILRSGDKDRIISRSSTDRDWSAAFPDAWDYQRIDALVATLRVDGLTGRHIQDMEPPCDTYEFFFYFDDRKVLGKIGLLPNGKVIIIFSSHIPRKGDQI